MYAEHSQCLCISLSLSLSLFLSISLYFSVCLSAAVCGRLLPRTSPTKETVVVVAVVVASLHRHREVQLARGTYCCLHTG